MPAISATVTAGSSAWSWIINGDKVQLMELIAFGLDMLVKYISTWELLTSPFGLPSPSLDCLLWSILLLICLPYRENLWWKPI